MIIDSELTFWRWCANSLSPSWPQIRQIDPIMTWFDKYFERLTWFVLRFFMQKLGQKNLDHELGPQFFFNENFRKLVWLNLFVRCIFSYWIAFYENLDIGVSVVHGSIWHDDVIKCKHFPRYWPFVRGIHRPPVNFQRNGQWRGALMFSLICVSINGWENNREAGDLRRYRAHYGVTVMSKRFSYCTNA